MEPLFAVRMTHDEDMYYNQVLASKQAAPVEKAGKKNFLSRLDISDVIFGILAFFVFYMTFPADELAQRVVQSALMAGVFVFVLSQMNGNKRREKQRIAPDADDRDQAGMILESSGRAGEACTVSFYEDSFQMENPGITTSYRYEGVAWIKETEQYYMIFWNRSTVIPVEKAGFYRGTPGQLKAFLEKKCQKTIMKAR
ncbi:MAG: YcxB family protein [Clostridium sp.]|nr:YcxB family protein [Clostridium sp.]